MLRSNLLEWNKTQNDSVSRARTVNIYSHVLYVFLVHVFLCISRLNDCAMSDRKLEQNSRTMQHGVQHYGGLVR